jgi:RimJ/RimL family protein N-acetyltransferase
MESCLFETDRLRIRHAEDSDLSDMFAIYGDIEVMRFLGAEPKAVETKEEIQAMIDRRKSLAEEFGDRLGAWCVVLKETNHVIGAVLFKPLPGRDAKTPSGEIEIGWHLGQAHWGQGFAIEASRACLHYGFSKNPELKRVLACFYPENTRSERIMQKLGMSYLEETDEYYGVPLSVYQITRESAGH